MSSYSNNIFPSDLGTDLGTFRARTGFKHWRKKFYNGTEILYALSKKMAKLRKT